MPQLENKNDLNRLGIFSELGYISINDPYVPPNSKPFNAAASKGKQMLCGGSKTKSALQAGYFDKAFPRILEGEGYNDVVKLKRQQRMQSAKKNVGHAFIPNHCGKAPSGAGSHYGTFSGPISTFSPQTKPRRAYTSPGRNFITNPSKKGTGYGYANVFLAKLPTYSSESYDRAKEIFRKEQLESKKKGGDGPFKLHLFPKTYFDSNPYHSDKNFPDKAVKLKKEQFKPFKPSAPGKELGGNKAGCFDVYPSHSNDPYIVKKNPFREGGKSGDKGVFRPSQVPKTTPTRSIINQNVDRRINRLNFRSSLAMTI